MISHSRIPSLLALACCCAAPKSEAVSLVLDYSYDTSGFFGVDSSARATLEQAAADLSSALGAVPLGAMSNNVIAGSSGGTTAIVTWSLSFTNPSTGTTETLSNPDLLPGFAADEIRIFVGWRNLSDSTLGQGGPAAAGISLNGSGTSSLWGGAVDAMELNSNAIMTRGNGPVMGTFSGSLPLGDTPAAYSLSYGAYAGTLWFDSDTNNNGTTDSALDLANYWNLEMALPSAGKADFYSVALHEMMHAIGAGTSLSWNSLSGDSSINGAHFSTGSQSLRLSDNSPQAAVLNATIPFGERRELTTMDMQYLSMIGFNAVPEPGTPLLLALGSAWLIRRRRPA